MQWGIGFRGFDSQGLLTSPPPRNTQESPGWAALGTPRNPLAAYLLRSPIISVITDNVQRIHEIGTPQMSILVKKSNFFFVRAVRIFRMIARCSKCDFWNLKLGLLKIRSVGQLPQQFSPWWRNILHPGLFLIESTYLNYVRNVLTASEINFPRREGENSLYFALTLQITLPAWRTLCIMPLWKPSMAAMVYRYMYR